MKLEGSARRKEKEKDINVIEKFFYQIMKWISLNINQLMRKIVNAEAATGGVV